MAGRVIRSVAAEPRDCRHYSDPCPPPPYSLRPSARRHSAGVRTGLLSYHHHRRRRRPLGAGRNGAGARLNTNVLQWILSGHHPTGRTARPQRRAVIWSDAPETGSGDGERPAECRWSDACDAPSSRGGAERNGSSERARGFRVVGGERMRCLVRFWLSRLTSLASVGRPGKLWGG